MEFKNCFITGGTSGIGKDVVKILSSKGHHVYFTARSKEKGESVVSEIKLENPKANISYLIGDLSSTEDVKNIAQELQNKIEKLDVLVNNAGSYTHEKTITEEGYEQQLLINYLVPKYFCEALLPLLKNSKQGRIVNVSSRMHMRGSTNIEDLNYTNQKYSGFKAYTQTKLLITSYTNFLASQIDGSTVSAVSMHPGVYSTGISRTVPKVFNFLWNLFIPGPIKGAENVVYLALENNKNGVYFDKTKASEPHVASKDTSFWNKIESIKFN